MDNSLPSLLKDAIADRLFGWELIDFLDIPVEDLIEIFEEEIFDNLTDIKELINFEELTDDIEERE